MVRAVWLVALCATALCVLLSEAEALDESKPAESAARVKLGTSRRVGWKDLSEQDKTMAARQADDSDVKALKYAQQQQSDQGVFSLDGEDLASAAHQGQRPAFDHQVQQEAEFLSSSEAVAGGSEVTPDAWERTRRQALARSREVSIKIEGMREDELDLGESDSVVRNNAANALRQLASELTSVDDDEDGDLGESASVSAKTRMREPEKIEKAKEKARLEMKTLTEAHLGQIKIARKHMQEKIQKSNDMRLESDRRARQLVPQAEDLWESQVKARKRAAERRKKASYDEAAQRLRREEAAILKEKQQASLDAEARESSVQNKADDIAMKEKQVYMQKMATADKEKEEALAKAKEQAEEHKLKYEEHMKRSKEKAKFKTEATVKQFENMRKKLQEKSDAAVANLRDLEMKASATAQEKYKTSEKHEKQTIKDAGARKTDASQLSKEQISKAEEQKKESDKQLGEAQNLKDKMGQLERQTERDKERKKREIERKKAGKIKSIKDEIKDTQEQAAEAERKMMQHGNTTDAKFKAKQMAWLDRAQGNAMNNCDDAKKEAILKSKAAHLSIKSLSRSIQDNKVVAQNTADDAERRSKELHAAKKKAAEALSKAVKKAAKTMATAGDGDMKGVKKAALDFATKSLPADRELKKLKTAEVDATKAKQMAAKRDSTWAQSKALKAADEFKENAQKTCDNQQRWFQRVRHRVKKRLGTSNEKDEKAVEKGEFQEQRWATRKVKILLGKEEAMTEQSVKNAMRVDQAAQNKQKLQEKAMKTKIEAAKEKARKLKREAEDRISKSKFRLKESIDAEDAKIKESRKLREMAERSAKSETNSAQRREKEQKAAMKGKQDQAMSKLKEREEKSVKLLKVKQEGRNERLRKIRQKQKELGEAARRREEQEIETARKKTEEKARLAHEEAQRKTREAKEKLEQAKSDSDKRMLKAKLEAARQREEAKRAMAAAIKGGGDKRKIIYAAKAQADKLLDGSKKRSVQLQTDAKKEFEDKVQEETAKSLKEVKAVQAKLKSQIQGLKRL